MMHKEGISALTRISDSVKSGLLLSAKKTEQIIAEYKKYEDIYNENKRLGALAQSFALDLGNIDDIPTFTNPSIAGFVIT